MHLDQEQVQRFLHGELAEAESVRIQEHLVECSECRTSVDRARGEDEEILNLLKALDHPRERPPLDLILNQARGRTFRPLRWAAAIVLTLGVTSVAYAAPGSPLPGWLDRLLGDSTPASDTPPPTEDSVPFGASPSGIAVSPGSSLTIRFVSFQAQGRIELRFEDRSDVAVQARNGGVGFTSDVDEILVENQGSESNFEILIPRFAPRIEILIGDELVFSSVVGRISGPAPELEGDWMLIDLRPPEV